jgi:cysteine desulfurase
MGFAAALDIASGRTMRFGTKFGSKRVVVADPMSRPAQIKEAARIQALKELFFLDLQKICPDVRLNPAALTVNDPALAPHILNVSIPGIDNEFFVLQLDAKGIAASTKSSCLRDADESYVLAAIGADSKTSVRFSFGRWTKRRDVAKTLGVIAKILKN